MTTERGSVVRRPISVAIAAGAAGAALALGALWASGELTSPANAQDPPTAGKGNITLSVAQLRINQRISQAAVRRSNESLDLLDPLRGTGLKGWRTQDLRDGLITGPKVADGAITGPKIGAGAVANANLAPNAVGTGNIADAAVTGPKLAAGSVGSANLTTDLANQLPLWAVVNTGGGLVQQRGATASANFGAGAYRVTFNRNVSACSFTATQSLGFGMIFALPDPANNAAVIVATSNNAGVATNRGFSVHVLC